MEQDPEKCYVPPCQTWIEEGEAMVDSLFCFSNRTDQFFITMGEENITY
jgi:hypothetical protein